MKENQALIASRKRAAHPDFVPSFSLGALRERLPFRCPEGVLPSPKRHYRSKYRYLGHEDLACPTHLANLHTLGRLVQEATTLAFKGATTWLRASTHISGYPSRVCLPTGVLPPAC